MFILSAISIFFISLIIFFRESSANTGGSDELNVIHEKLLLPVNITVDGSSLKGHWQLRFQIKICCVLLYLLTLLSYRELTLGRRNHDCIIHNGEAIFFGGRFNNHIETMNLQTGHHHTSLDFPALNLNHIFGVPVFDNNRNFEIWIPCGFVGEGRVNRETGSLQHVMILKKSIDGSWLPPVEGPKLDKPTGACGALALHLDGPSQPAHVCKFGGSDGRHDKGIYSNAVSCYSRLNNSWSALPPLPDKADHLTVVSIPPRVCSENDPAKLFFFNYRNKSYSVTIPKLWALDLHPEVDGSVRRWRDWYRYDVDADDPKSVASVYGGDAAGVTVAHGGRYIIAFGGINWRLSWRKQYAMLGKVAHSIRVFDVCKRRWFLSKHQLRDPRFAVETCQHEKRPIICGGTYTPGMVRGPREKLFSKRESENLRSCEAFDATEVVENLEV